MTQFSMANSVTPVFIVKPTFKICEEPRGFLVAVDGLKASSNAFLFALKCVRPLSTPATQLSLPDNNTPSRQNG